MIFTLKLDWDSSLFPLIFSSIIRSIEYLEVSKKKKPKWNAEQLKIWITDGAVKRIADFKPRVKVTSASHVTWRSSILERSKRHETKYAANENNNIATIPWLEMVRYWDHLLRWNVIHFGATNHSKKGKFIVEKTWAGTLRTWLSIVINWLRYLRIFVIVQEPPRR